MMNLKAKGPNLLGEAYDAKTEEFMFRDTVHISMDGKTPLCGVPAVHGDNSNVHSEPVEYPLTQYNVCERCTTSYLSRHGSNDELFEEARHISDGDWVEFEVPGEISGVGRVRRATDANERSKYLWIVTNDAPKERWVYGEVDVIKLRFSEEGQEFADERGDEMTSEFSEVDGIQIEQIDPPENNIDQRTAEVISELEDVISDYPTGQYGGVKVIGKRWDEFTLRLLIGESETNTLVESLPEHMTVEEVKLASEREKANTVIHLTTAKLPSGPESS